MNTINPAFISAAMSSSLMIILAVVAIMSSRISRPDVVFAVTVNPDFRASAEGRRILSQFTWIVLLSSALGLASLWLVWGKVLPPLFFAVSWMIALGGHVLGYTLARRQVAPHRVVPSAQHEAAVRPREIHLAGGWLGQLGPLLILAACSIYLALQWSNIPERFPIHWGLNGEPNGWSTRGPAVFFGPIVGALTCLFLTGFAILTMRETRRVRSAGSAGAQETRNLRNVQWMLLFVNYYLSFLLGGLSLLPVVGPRYHVSAGTIVIVSLLGELVLITVILAMAMRAGQGGWRFRAAEATSAGAVAVGDRTPDECWKGGLIYWNPNDPAVLVEKRFGYGWTLNFANPRSWLVLGGILLFSLSVTILSIVLTK